MDEARENKNVAKLKNDTKLAFHCAQISINLALSYNVTQSERVRVLEKEKFQFSSAVRMCIFSERVTPKGRRERSAASPRELTAVCHHHFSRMIKARLPHSTMPARTSACDGI